jgi:RNA polymerase sigma factor (sigma-70 family)
VAIAPEPSGEAAALVARAVAGDREAWNAIVRQHARMLLRTARATGLDQEAALDVVQVTWLLAAQRLDRLQDPSALSGWLATIVRRESSRYWHTHKREVASELEGYAETVAPERTEAQALMAERDRLLWEVFARISERCQQLLRLLLAEVPYVQISEMLSMPVGSIGPTRQRCLASLRTKVAEAGINDALNDL